MSKYNRLKNPQGIFFIGIPSCLDDGNTSMTVHNRISAITRRVARDAEYRSQFDETSPLLRNKFLMETSIIVRCDDFSETNIVCGIVEGVVAHSHVQIVGTCHKSMKTAEGAIDVLEKILSKGHPVNDGVRKEIEYVWIPVHIEKERSGLSASNIYSCPIMDFMKKTFPKFAASVDFTNLIRITSRNQPHVIAIYPATEQVVLATDFEFQLL